MAKRPVFVRGERIIDIKEIEFTWYPGFAPSQKIKSIIDLHKSYLKLNPAQRVLEISSKSTEPLGQALSAFNLIINIDGKDISFESLFQGSKVFENGGPFEDILWTSAINAKRDVRLRTSGDIVGFRLLGEDWPSEPKTFFYDWMYIKAVADKPELLEKLLEYDAFTDIEFNPKKSLNCQAKAAALIVTLYKGGFLQDVLSKPELLKNFYSEETQTKPKRTASERPDQEQLKLF